MHRRGDLHEPAQVKPAGGTEIGHADDPKPAGLIALPDRHCGLFVSGVGGPDLRGDEQFSSKSAALGDGTACASPAAVNLGGIDAAADHVGTVSRPSGLSGYDSR